MESGLRVPDLLARGAVAPGRAEEKRSGRSLPRVELLPRDAIPQVHSAVVGDEGEAGPVRRKRGVVDLTPQARLRHEEFLARRCVPAAQRPVVPLPYGLARPRVE